VANNVKQKNSHKLALEKKDALFKSEIDKSKRTLKKLEDENSRLKSLEPISTLKDQEICTLQVEVENLKDQLCEMEKFRSQLKIFAGYKEKYDEQCRKNELMSEMEGYREMYYELQETVKGIEDERFGSKKTSEKLRLKNRELESELEMLRVNYRGLEGELEFLEQTKVKGEQRMRDAEGRFDANDAEQKKKIREYEVSIGEWKSKSERGERELSCLKEETKVLGKRLEGKETDLAKENELRLKGESRARELEWEKRELVSESDTLRQAIEDIQEIGSKDTSSLKENLKNLEKQREVERELKRKLSAEREAGQIISKDLESLKTDNQDLIVQNRALENQNSDLASLIKSLKNQQGGISQTLDSKTNQLSSLESEVAALRSEKLELMQQLADSRKRHSDKLKSVSNEYEERLKN
jgi:chromosome segregation ATPase